jgi:hypothetical protein
MLAGSTTCYTLVVGFEVILGRHNNNLVGKLITMKSSNLILFLFILVNIFCNISIDPHHRLAIHDAMKLSPTKEEGGPQHQDVPIEADYMYSRNSLLTGAWSGLMMISETN